MDERTADTSSLQYLYIYNNTIIINSDISIQERHWLPLSVHLWAHRTHPTHDVNDVWRLATPPGSGSPTLFEQWCGFFYIPQEPDKCKCCEAGPTVFHPYSRRLESLIVCRCHCKGRTSQLFWVPECWSGQGSNLRPPAHPADQHSPNWANQATVKLTNVHFAFSVILD